LSDDELDIRVVSFNVNPNTALSSFLEGFLTGDLLLFNDDELLEKLSAI